MSLQSETESLWRAGAVKLPNAAVSFADAAKEVHKTGSIDPDAFGDSPIKAPWVSLRNRLQDEVLVVTHDNLIKAGNALAKIAIHYAATDTAAKDNLNDVIQNIGDEADENQPPDYIPPAPTTNDPHPTGPQY